MTEAPSGKRLQKNESPQLRIIERLLRAKATAGVWNVHFWIILGLMAALGYIYYGVLTAFHDVYVILFFYPLIYAAIIYLSAREEDKNLVQQFGKDYLAYMKRVPRMDLFLGIFRILQSREQ